MKNLKNLLILLAVISAIFVLSGCPDAGAGTETPATDDDTGTEQSGDDGAGTGTTTPDPVYYSVNYDANGATSGTAPVDYTGYEDGASADIAENSAPLARDGYAFAGWCTTADSTGDIYTEGDTMTMDAADITLYARWVKRGFIANSAGLGNDYNLGHSVDLNEDGSRMISGALGYNSNQGVVIFYNRNAAGSWDYDTSITIPSGGTGDNFGGSVAMDDSGTIAVAGAGRYEALDSNDTPVERSGYAMIMKYEDDTWSIKHNLVSAEPEVRGYFGWAVAVSGDGSLIVISESYRDDGSTQDTGLIHIYTTTDNWETYNHSELDDTYASSMHAGYSLAVNDDGTRIIVGTSYTYFYGPPNQSVYVYDSSDNWATYSREVIDGNVLSSAFGTAVDCSADGNVVCIGNYSANDSGEAYLYRYVNNSWEQEETFTSASDTASDHFGKNIAVSGDGRRVYIGASSEDTYESNAGNAYLFEYNNGSWDRFENIIQESFNNIDQFGSDVAISGDGKIIAAGCSESDILKVNPTDINAGNVFFYTFEE